MRWLGKIRSLLESFHKKDGIGVSAFPIISGNELIDIEYKILIKGNPNIDTSKLSQNWDIVYIGLNRGHNVEIYVKEK